MIEAVKFWLAKEVAVVLMFLGVLVFLLILTGVLEWHNSRTRKKQRPDA
jgi:hypothetical protein